MTSQKPVKFLRLPAVISLTGLSRSTIYHFLSLGTFPKPVNIGARSIAWIESEIETWMRCRIEEARRR